MDGGPKPEDWACLGVAVGTPAAECRAAYVTRARALHPDTHPDATSEERRRLEAAMTALNLAWDRIERAGSQDHHAPPPAADRPNLHEELEPPPGFQRWRAVKRPDQVAFRLVGNRPGPLRALHSFAAPALVVGLQLADAEVSEGDLGHVRGFDQLRLLDLGGNPLGDRAVRALGHLTQLRELRLAHTAVTDDGLLALAAFPHLERLSLQGTDVSDQGMAPVAALPRLRYLDLRRTKVSAAGVRHLLTRSGLVTLNPPRLPWADRRRLADLRPDVELL